MFLPNDIKTELVLAGLLFVNAYTNIRAPLVPWVSTTDATPSRGGSTSAIVANEVVSTLYRAAPTRGSLVRLDSKILDHGPVRAEADQVIEDLVGCIPWKVVRNRGFSQTSHINLQEKRAASSEPRRRAELSLAPSRFVDFADSSVHIGSARHGRPSSIQLNGLMRQDIGWQVAGSKTEVPLYINTKHNPSDDPSRDVPLRAPQACPAWARPLVTPAADTRLLDYVLGLGRPRLDRSRRLRICSEVYSGCGQLSQSMRRCRLHVGRPWEAYLSKNVYVRISDIDDDQVFDGPMYSILAGYVFHVHFGCPCKTWGAAARMKGCTCTTECPEGDGTLPREVNANWEVGRVCALCVALVSVGGFFSIENPAGSYIFKYSPVAPLSTITQCWLFNVCQCHYGLQLPGADKYVFCQKRTSILTNMQTLCTWAKPCPGISPTHQHESAWGSRAVDGKHVS